MSTQVEKAAEAYYERHQRTKTWSGIPLKEIYTPKDIEGLDYERDLSDAGQYPFTRGIYPDMYRGRIWTRRLGWGYGTAAETNKQFKFLLAEGNTGLNLFRDLPSTLGIDPDHPMARGEVGRDGVSLCTMADMEEIFEGIPIEKISTNILCASCVGPVVLSLYFAAAEKRGISLDKLRGTHSNDPIMGYFCYSKEANPLDLCVKAAGDVIEFCTKNMPLWHAFQLSVPYNIRDSGLNAPQEIAIGLATAIAYIEEALRRGLKIDDFGPRASFYCNAGIDFFEEIAKLRAMRRMWAKIVRERFGAKDPNSWKFRFGVHTAGSSLVPQQPLNNIIRIAYEQLVAVLAGAQSINSCTFDEPVCLPTELSQRIALRTQQIVAYETGVASVADPLGGSYYVEYLTNKMEEEASNILHQVEDMGGMLETIRSGWWQRVIDEGSLQYQKEIEGGERIIVGMNAFTNPPEEDFIPGGVLRIPLEVEEEQIAKVKKIKETRDSNRVRETIGKLRQSAQRGENLMPPIIEAVKSYATVEEIQGTIREAFGYSWDPWGVRKSPFSEDRGER